MSNFMPGLKSMKSWRRRRAHSVTRIDSVALHRQLSASPAKAGDSMSRKYVGLARHCRQNNRSGLQLARGRRTLIRGQLGLVTFSLHREHIKC